MLSISHINSLWVYVTALIILAQNDQILCNYIKQPTERFTLDVTSCSLFHKLCSHLDEDLPILSCSLKASYNKTQIPPNCQQIIWTHQNDMLDNAYLNHKLKGLCAGELSIINCLKSSNNGIDCILKKKASVIDKNCWRMINKIESLIFNDWQITGNFLKNCYDDIQAHTCGRIPSDPKSLSQIQTLKCLQNNEPVLRPECLSEVDVLQDMKYTTLQLDKIIFAACNLEQKSFCPDEVPESWLMYKCLLRHKYESGKLKLI